MAKIHFSRLGIRTLVPQGGLFHIKGYLGMDNMRIRIGTERLRQRSAEIAGETVEQADPPPIPMVGPIHRNSVVNGRQLAAFFGSPASMERGKLPADAVKQANAFIRRKLRHLVYSKGVVITTGEELYKYVTENMKPPSAEDGGL